MWVKMMRAVEALLTEARQIVSFLVSRTLSSMRGFRKQFLASERPSDKASDLLSNLVTGHVHKNGSQSLDVKDRESWRRHEVGILGALT